MSCSHQNWQSYSQKLVNLKIKVELIKYGLNSLFRNELVSMKPQDKRKVSVLTYFIILQSVDKDITNYEFELHTALTSLIREKNIITQVQFQIFLGFCK